MTTTAFVNEGRWVAFCADPDCQSAEQDWGRRRVKPDGTPFGIVGNILFCGHCGQQSMVEFPPERQGITALLARRPVPETRNWRPGESLADLVGENVTHGVD